MKIKLYVLNTGLLGINNIEIEKYSFDFNSKKDIELIQECNDDEIDEDNFVDSCINFLHENVGIELSQRFIPYIILDEIQYKQLKQII